MAACSCTWSLVKLPASPTALTTHFTTRGRSTRWWDGNGGFLGGSRRRQLHVLGDWNQTSHRLRNRSLIQPIGRRRRRRRRRRGVLPLVHLLRIRQLGRCPLTTAAQAALVGFHLGPKDGQLDLLVVNLEDGCQYSTKASRIASATLALSSSILTRLAHTRPSMISSRRTN